MPLDEKSSVRRPRVLSKFSTKIQVCHNRRIKMHKVFQNIGKRGKTSVDWFFGFKLHLVFDILRARERTRILIRGSSKSTYYFK